MDNNKQDENARIFNRIADEAMMKSRIDNCAKEMKAMMEKELDRPKTRLDSNQ